MRREGWRERDREKRHEKGRVEKKRLYQCWKEFEPASV